MKTRKYVVVLVILAANILWAFEFLSSAETPIPMATWTSVDGRTITAKKLRIEGENVVLERSDGEVFSVPLSRLSPESRAMARMDALLPIESENRRGEQMQPAQPPALVNTGNLPQTAPTPESQASVNKETVLQTPLVTQSSVMINKETSLQRLPEVLTPESANKEASPPTETEAQPQAAIIVQQQSLMATWWDERFTLARIFLVSLLVMFGSNFRGLITRLVVAALVIILFPVDSWLPSGLSRLTQFAACFAAVSFLPGIFKMGSSIPLIFPSAVLFGLPTLLISHYFFGSSWALATADAVVGVVLLSVWVIRAIVRVKERNDEERKVAQKDYLTQFERVSSQIPNFLGAVPKADDLAELLGIREPEAMKRMQLLESRLTRDPARTGLTSIRKMLKESQSFATRAEEISEALHQRVNGAHNALTNRARGERDPYATERQHHYEGLRKDLDWLEPSLKQFQSEWTRFQNELRSYLTRTIVNHANGDAWGDKHVDEWQDLLRHASFEDYTLEKLARAHYGL